MRNKQSHMSMIPLGSDNLFCPLFFITHFLESITMCCFFCLASLLFVPWRQWRCHSIPFCAVAIGYQDGGVWGVDSSQPAPAIGRGAGQRAAGAWEQETTLARCVEQRTPGANQKTCSNQGKHCLAHRLANVWKDIPHPLLLKKRYYCSDSSHQYDVQQHPKQSPSILFQFFTEAFKLWSVCLILSNAFPAHPNGNWRFWQASVSFPTLDADALFILPVLCLFILVFGSLIITFCYLSLLLFTFNFPFCLFCLLCKCMYWHACVLAISELPAIDCAQCIIIWNCCPPSQILDIHFFLSFVFFLFNNIDRKLFSVCVCAHARAHVCVCMCVHVCVTLKHCGVLLGSEHSPRWAANFILISWLIHRNNILVNIFWREHSSLLCRITWPHPRLWIQSFIIFAP